MLNIWICRKTKNKPPGDNHGPTWHYQPEMIYQRQLQISAEKVNLASSEVSEGPEVNESEEDADTVDPLPENVDAEVAQYNSSTDVVLFRDSLLPRPESGPESRREKRETLSFPAWVQAHSQGGVRGSPGTGLVLTKRREWMVETLTLRNLTDDQLLGTTTRFGRRIRINNRC